MGGSFMDTVPGIPETSHESFDGCFSWMMNQTVTNRKWLVVSPNIHIQTGCLLGCPWKLVTS